MRHKLKLALGVGGHCRRRSRGAPTSRSTSSRASAGTRSRPADTVQNDLRKVKFNDRASSAVVDNAAVGSLRAYRFGGQCVVLQPGSYDSLKSMGLNNSDLLGRGASRGASHAYEMPPPLAQPSYDYRYRPDEAHLSGERDLGP